MKALRDDILKCLNNMTERAATLAETSLHVAKGVGKGNVFNYVPEVTAAHGVLNLIFTAFS